MNIEIRTCTARQLVYDLSHDGVKVGFVHADPPWQYSKAAPPGHGRVGQHNTGPKAPEHYDGMTMSAIVEDLFAAAHLADNVGGCYLACWATFPTLWQFAREWHTSSFRQPPPWQELTGGAWGKVGRRGIGFHMQGDAEPLLVFRRGRPKPREQCSNRWETEAGAWSCGCTFDVRNVCTKHCGGHAIPSPQEVRTPAPYWRERRSTTHSEKPAAALVDLVKLATDPGDLVVDLYAGESASLARACYVAGRDYVGAEASQGRAETARRLLADLVEP